jgi:peptidoglycan L-alanyl-D-glutamate endopeptidase CwlK
MGIDRDVANLTEKVRGMILQLIQRAERVGITVKIGEGRRSKATQAVYYLRGRVNISDPRIVDAMQILGAAHAWPFTKKEVGTVVTQTLNSNHLDGNAVDILVFNNDGTIDWSGTSGKWKTVLEIARAIGFTCGADWKDFPDYPHLEYRG